MSDQDQINIAMVKRLFASILEDDREAIKALLAPDVVVHEADSMPYGGSFHGHDGYFELLRKLDECWIGLHARDWHYTAGDGDVAARCLLTGTSRISGKAIHQQIIELWTVRSGKLTEGRIFYFDTHAVHTACSGSV